MKKTLVVLAIIVVVVAGGFLIIYGWPGSPKTAYQFAEAERGDLENVVTASGTLSPVTTVDVGTQVSGTIDSVFVDYNDRVTSGQVLAVLDTALLKAAVLDAEATVDRNEALLKQSEADYERNQALREQSLISDAEFLPYEVGLKTQQASLKSARVALDRARRNLEYAIIRSPIDGIVIARNVEAGQTVAASLSTPTLFVIAQDLSDMEILADVDESDIGEIKPGQPVRFEVSAYSNMTFEGKVTQIRLQPTTISNVVTYTVVVAARNNDGVLLPGMTATLDFITDRRTDVLLVPNKALRFRPSEDQMQAFFAKRRQAHEQSGGPRPPHAQDSGSVPRDTGSMSMVWYLDSLGQLAATPVRTGMTDGSNTEVLSSRSLTAGMQVIVGMQDESATASTSSRQRRPMGFGPPRGF